MLPIYYLEIKDGDTFNFMSFVDSPATEIEWAKFSSLERTVQLAVQDEQIVSGVVLVPDQKIYRKDDDGREYYVAFNKETIKKFAELVIKKSASVDLNHSENPVEGVHLIEIFIKDSSKGINPNYVDVPDGSLIASYKVDNMDVWNKIKSGDLNGFSIDAVFNYSEEDQLRDIYKMLKKLKNIK